MSLFRISTLSVVVSILTSGSMASAQIDSERDIASLIEAAEDDSLEFLPPEDQRLWYAHEPRVGIGHDVGEGIGYDGSFTTFEGFIPLFRESEQSLFFADLRLLLDNDSLVGGNVGLGSRRYLVSLDRTLGRPPDGHLHFSAAESRTRFAWR